MMSQFQEEEECTLACVIDDYLLKAHRVTDDNCNTKILDDNDESLSPESQNTSSESLESPSNVSYAVSQSTLDDVTAMAVDVGQKHADSSAATGMLDVKDASEEIFHSINEYIAQIEEAVAAGKDIAKYTPLIKATGNQSVDYLIELGCIAMFLKKILYKLKQKYSWSPLQLVSRSLTDALNAMRRQDAGVTVRSTESIDRAELSELHRKSEETVNAFMICLQHVPYKEVIRKTWHDIQFLLSKHMLQIRATVEYNIFTTMLEELNEVRKK